jgi:outer membrane protein OmpA-like peptidoglycan-associated protein
VPAITLLALVATGCTGGGDADGADATPRAQDRGDGAADGAALPGDGPEAGDAPVDLTEPEVLASAASLQGDGLELEVLRLERIGADALSLVWQVRNTSGEDVTVNQLFGATSADGVAVEADGRRSPPFRDEDGNCLCVGLIELGGTIPAGGVKGYHTVHPDLGTDTVSVVTRRFEDVEDVPVVDAVEATPSEDRPAVRLRSGDGSDVHLDVHGLERHGPVAVLRATLTNDTGSTFRADMTRAAVSYSWGADRRRLGTTGRVSFVDPTTERHHRVLDSPEGWCYCENSAMTSGGDARELAWVFDAPEETTTHVTVTVPWFGTVPGVPVVEDAGDLQLELNGEVVDELEVAGENHHGLVRTVEEFDGDLVTRVTQTDGLSTGVALAADVLFDFDSAELRAEADPLLDDLVAQLEELELSGPVIVEGHTDAEGGRAYNQELSERRAESVRERLGSSLRRTDVVFETVGFGQDEPVVDNDTAENRQRNRRVTIRIPNGPTGRG